MKRNKGFTLIELLAVIVILAIIALIATPIVLNIIKDSKDSATLQSAEFYLGAVETAVAKKIIDDPTFKPKSCEIQKDGNLKCNGIDVKIEINGEKPTSGTIILENGEIEDVELVLNEKIIVKNSEGKLEYSVDSATLQSAKFYLGAVETAVAKKIMDDPTFKPTICEIQKDGNLKCGETDVKVEINGEKPTSGTIILKSGEIEDVELILNEKTVVKNSEGKLVYDDIEPSEPLFTGTLAYSEDTENFLFDSMIDFGLLKPKTNYKITLIDSNKETIVIDNLVLYTLEGIKVLSTSTEESGIMLMCDNGAGACIFIYDALNSEQEYKITLEEQDEKFIPYQFLLKRQYGSSRAMMHFYTMNIEKGAIFDLLIKDDDNNIYFNESKTFTGVTGDTIGKFSYNADEPTYNTELNSMFDAIKSGKKITMTLSFYDYDSSTENGQVDEYVFEPSDAICIETNSLNECIEYIWGNKNLFIDS